MPSPRPTLLDTLILLIAVVSAAPALGQEEMNFELRSLDVPGRVRAVLPADFNDDGLADLAVAYADGVEPNERRWLTLFWQTESGFSPAEQPLEVPSHAALVDVVEAPGGDALLIMGSDGVDVLRLDASGSPAGFDAVLDTETLLFHGELGDLVAFDFARDLFGDGAPRLVIPKWGQIAIAELGEDGAWALAHTIDVPQRAFYSKGPRRYGIRSEDYALQVTIRSPQLEAADMNGDGRPELLVHVDENLFIYTWGEEGALDSWPTTVRHFEVRSEEEKRAGGVSMQMHVEDVNGDAIPDVVINLIKGGISAMRSRTEIYLGAADFSLSEAPARVFDEAGYGSSLQFVDLNGDGAAELIAPHASMGLWQLSQIAMSGKIELEVRVHPGGPEGPAVDPIDDFDATVLVDYSKGATLKSPDPNFEGDFNGDGRPDLLITRGVEHYEVILTSETGELLDDAPVYGAEVPISRYQQVFDAGGDPHDDVLLYYPWDEERAGRVEVLMLSP